MNGTDFNSIDLDQIRTVLTIAEMHSFSRAAEALGVQQSAISHQVHRIERKLGRTLFRRNRSGVVPTADGEAMLIYARAIARLTDDMRRHFRDSAGVEKLRVGFDEAFSRIALPIILNLFRKEHPCFQVMIQCGHEEALFKELDQGAVDLVVTRSYAVPIRGDVLWTDKIRWVGRPDLKLSVSEPIPLILPPSTSGLTKLVLSTLRNHGLTWRVLFESWSLVNLESALRSGIGISALPRGMEVFGFSHLDGDLGLPELPDTTFVIEARRSPEFKRVNAFCDTLRQAALFNFKDALADASSSRL